MRARILLVSVLLAVFYLLDLWFQRHDPPAVEPPIVRVSGCYLVPSTSRAGVIHRVDDVAGCNCEAGRAGRSCRHAAAIELVEQAQTHTMPALAPLNDRIARARAEAEAARLALLECF